MVAKNLLKRGGRDMKRRVEITCETREEKEYYILRCNSKEILVDKSLKKIPGKELFETIYLDYSKNNSFEVEVDDSALAVDDKKVFSNYVRSLFEKIDAELKKQFLVETEQGAPNE